MDARAARCLRISSTLLFENRFGWQNKNPRLNLHLETQLYDSNDSGLSRIWSLANPVSLSNLAYIIIFNSSQL